MGIREFFQVLNAPRECAPRFSVYAQFALFLESENFNIKCSNAQTNIGIGTAIGLWGVCTGPKYRGLSRFSRKTSFLPLNFLQIRGSVNIFGRSGAVRLHPPPPPSSSV